MPGDVDHSAVLRTLEKLVATSEKYVDEQSPTNESEMEMALDEHCKTLRNAKETGRAAVVGVTQMEFKSATPAGKRTIAAKIHEDLGNIGVRGALSCAVAGVTGSAVKLRQAWEAGELLGGQEKVKEEAGPKRRNEPLPSSVDNDGTMTNKCEGAAVDGGAYELHGGGGKDSWGVKEKLEIFIGQLGTALTNGTDVKEQPCPAKNNGTSPACADHEQTLDGTNGDQAGGITATVVKTVTETYGRVMDKLGPTLAINPDVKEEPGPIKAQSTPTGTDEQRVVPV